MLTFKQIYDAYPDSDLLPIEVHDGMTLADLEALAGFGDTLFLFICRELLEDADEGYVALALRCRRASADCMAVVNMLDQLAAESTNVDVASHVAGVDGNSGADEDGGGGRQPV